MKRLLPLLVLNFFTLILLSQARPEKRTIEIDVDKPALSPNINFKIGGGIPIGDFGDDDGGLAVGGVMFEGELQQPLKPTLYLSFAFRLQSNDINDQIISDEVSRLLVQGGQTGLSVSTIADPWKTNSFMVGLGTISPIGDATTSLLTRFSIGYASIRASELDIRVSDQFGNTQVTNQEGEIGGAFAFQFGLSLKIEVSETTDVLFTADYFNAEAEFNNVLISSSNPGVASITTDFDQQVTLLNLSFGVAFKL